MDRPPVTIDGINWTFDELGRPHPICRKHHLPLYCTDNWSVELECAECEGLVPIPRIYNDELVYVKDKVDSKELKKIKFLNLDDEAMPLAEVKLKSKDNKYFAVGLLTESKVGLRLVIYAGEQGKSDKTQIFVEPEIRRISFDQTNINPLDVFIKFEGTFADGTKITTKKPRRK